MTTELKNLYEDLIIDMIRENVLDISSELKQKIKEAPVEKRRAMILTFMEENNTEHRLLCDSIRKIAEHRDRSKSNHIKEIVTMVREYVSVSSTERKLGEVMTPLTLVSDMLDTLPAEVWTNPDLKWLDPCNGVGTFTSVIVERLMGGLKSWEPNDELRYEHIMENMIHVCELQAKNMFLYLYSFDPEDRYAVNVYNGSYLDEGFDQHMELWSITKFDVIVMNPPYQEQKEGNTKSSPLWNKFVIKTIDNLTEGGHLVAVHPSGWRNVDGTYKNVQTTLKNRQMLYLEIHNMSDGLKTFGAETRYDFYCLQNVPCVLPTKIKCEDGTIEREHISKMEFIPNGMFKSFANLISKNGEERVNVLYSRSSYATDKPHISKTQTEEFKFPVVYRVRKDESMTFWYSNTKELGHFGVPKLIWSDGRVKSVGCYMDDKGEYALNQFQYGIIDDIDKLPHVKKAFDSKNFRSLMEQCQVSNMSINRKVIALFRKDFWKEFI